MFWFTYQPPLLLCDISTIFFWVNALFFATSIYHRLREMCKLTLLRAYCITIVFVEWNEVHSRTHTCARSRPFIPHLHHCFHTYNLAYFLFKGDNGSNKKIYQLMYVLSQASSIYLSLPWALPHPIDCGSISCTHSYTLFYQSAYSPPPHCVKVTYACLALDKFNLSNNAMSSNLYHKLRFSFSLMLKSISTNCSFEIVQQL